MPGKRDVLGSTIFEELLEAKEAVFSRVIFRSGVGKSGDGTCDLLSW